MNIEDFLLLANQKGLLEASFGRCWNVKEYNDRDKTAVVQHDGGIEYPISYENGAWIKGWI